MEKEVRLIKKRRKGLLGLVFSRSGGILILLVLSALLLFMVFTMFARWIYYIFGGFILFDIIVIIGLINTDMDSSAKLTWILVVSVTSIFGALFYLYSKSNLGFRTVKNGYREITEKHRDAIKQDEETLNKLKEENQAVANLYTYLNRNNTFPISEHNEVTYYPLGENKWEAMLEELEKAEKFIFMEYFIIGEGKMWGEILAILKRKAAEGVEVRVMYDGTCSMSTLPYSYPEMLGELGIKAQMFAPLLPFVSTHYNYRDHRKILVIDGKVGFNGGVNLADEYINAEERFGHWKDTAIRIKGPAVKSLTLMFLNMWNFGETNPEYDKYLNIDVEENMNAQGYVMPYGFNPFDKDRIGEKVYMNILNRADKYVHIMSPYLILDDELLMAIKFAAERGVDVKLMLPGIPDKKAVYALAKTYFKTLLDSGVEVYLYTPGFVHAKVFVSDDTTAVVGTINLDYRSLYHHFECGTYLYKSDSVTDIENDFNVTLQKCQKVTYESIKNEKLLSRLVGRVSRLVAPML